METTAECLVDHNFERLGRQNGDQAKVIPSSGAQEENTFATTKWTK